MAIRPITDTRRRLHNGCLLDDSSEQMAALVQAVAERKATGLMPALQEQRL